MAIAVLCFGSSAFANTIVSMQFINSTAPAYGTTSVAAYNFYINPPTTIVTPLICDDYADGVTNGETWNALKTALPDVNSTNTYFFAAVGMPGYEEAAWLAQQLYAAGLTSPASQTVTDLNYAIWAVFDPGTGPGTGALKALDATEIARVNADLALAQGHANDPTSDYANVYFYTPVDANGNVLRSAPRPQEFIGIPEASTVALSGVGLLGLLSLMFLFPGKVRIA
jgi:hypothetical protein